jgi:hypothetical protein
MSNEFVAGLHFVKVYPPQPQFGSEFQIWIAATGADQAVSAVLARLGPGWRGERLLNAPTKAQAARVKLRPGDVCEFSSGL